MYTECDKFLFTFTWIVPRELFITHFATYFGHWILKEMLLSNDINDRAIFVVIITLPVTVSVANFNGVFWMPLVMQLAYWENSVTFDHNML